jgi:ornithine carbamoyltransferase
MTAALAQRVDTSAPARQANGGPRHFLDLDRLPSDTLRGILARSGEIKGQRREIRGAAPLAGRTLALLFERPSTRTRVSFEVAMREMGGDVVVLRPDEMQLKRGETIGDTARVLSRYVDAIMMRTGSEARLQELAANATVPVINGLTEQSHPCQVMADLMTFEEHRGSIAGRTVAWSGDGNNVCASWIHAAGRFDFTLRVATPPELAPEPRLVAWAHAQGARLELTRDPDAAARDADLVVTDAWVSMGDNDANRHNLLRPYQVDGRLMALAKPDALFMHCLPAHRGEEVTAEVMDGPQSVALDEAENRLHVQKGILAWCLGRGD